MADETPKRGRPKKPDKRQASFDDTVIEDPEIAEALEVIAASQQAAKDARAAANKVRKLMIENHPEAINAERNGKSGYVVCGTGRFWAGRVEAPERQQLAKTIPAKTSWQPLDVHSLNLFTQNGVEA